MKIIFCFLLIFLFSGVALAAPLPSRLLDEANAPENKESKKIKRSFHFLEKTEWKRGDIQTPYLKLNALRFTNRARCAADSEKPTQSFYVLVDSLNVAKGAYRLALATGQDKNLLSRQAVERFRYSVLKLVDNISQKILRGDLPLLPSDLSEKEVQEYDENGEPLPLEPPSAENYRRITESCRLDEYCNDLDSYISSVWNYPKGKDKKDLHWNEVDNFSEENFLSLKKIAHKDETPSLACYYLKKHSPLESQLDTVIPDKASLTMIANAMIDQKNLLASCDDMEAQKSIEFSSYQIDLKGLKTSAWKRKGFDFHHSLKLYFSWAWRNAPEIASFTYPFQHYFKSVHLEDSVMFFSNGCQSIVKPTCDTTFLNEQTLRNFAQEDYARSDSSFDNMLYLPEGATGDLIKNPTVDVNNDVLDFSKFPSMDEWMKNFRENIRKGRGIMKGRLVRSLTLMDMALKNLTKAQILTNLKELKENVHPFPYNLGSRTQNDLKLKQFYALCGESFMATDEVLSFLRKDISLIKDLKTLDPLFERFTDYDLEHFYSYYEDLFVGVRGFCKELETQKFWAENFEMEKGFFAPWYKEAIYKGQVAPLPPEAQEVIGTPLLAYSFFSTTKSTDQVICWDGVDCSRKVLESIINLYSLAQYKELYFPKNQNIQTPDLANPYAERVACKVYDPWWQTKKAFFHLTTNVGQAALSLVNTTPFYLTVDLAPKTVVSFNKMVEDGTIKLEPQFDSKRVLATFGADFGKWLGVPCSVSVSNYANVPRIPTRTYFTGLTLEACRSHTQTGAVITNGSEVDKNPDVTVSGCVSCSLNFAKVMENPNSTIPIPIPYVQAAFYLFRGSILFFKELRDPVNVPHHYVVNPNYVLETYRRYGEIPKNCVKNLKDGKPCMENLCEQSLASFFQEEVGGSIQKLDLSFDKAKVKLTQCENEIDVKDMRHFLNLVCNKKIDKSQVQLSDICKMKNERINHEIR